MLTVRIPAWLRELALVSLGMIIVVPAFLIAWHLIVIWQHQLPTTSSLFVHGFLVAPPDLPDAQHINSFSVTVIPGDVIAISRIFTGTVGEQWQAVLVYRTDRGEVKTRIWKFRVACDSATGGYFSLSRVHTLQLIRNSTPEAMISPLRIFFTHIPGLEGEQMRPPQLRREQKRYPPNWHMVAISPRLFIRAGRFF